jgi:chromosome segregation ATPase
MMLTFLKGAANCERICQMLGTVVGLASADVGVHSLRLLGCYQDENGDVQLREDNLLAQLAGWRQRALSMTESCRLLIEERARLLEANQQLATDLNALRNGVANQREQMQADLLTLQQRRREIESFLASEQAKLGAERRTLDIRMAEISAENASAAMELVKMDQLLADLRGERRDATKARWGAKQDIDRLRAANESLQKFYVMMSSETSNRFVRVRPPCACRSFVGVFGVWGPLLHQARASLQPAFVLC